MDIYTHIVQEHGFVKDMLKKIEAADREEKPLLMAELDTVIRGHLQAEEHLVFPAVEAKTEKESQEATVQDMFEDHREIRLQLDLIRKITHDENTWDEDFYEAKRRILHHIFEEESEFIPLAKEILHSTEGVLEAFEKMEEEYQIACENIC